MNEKEVAEIRRCLTPEKATVTVLRGCYVNANGEVIAKFDRSVARMSEDEAAKYLALFKKTLTGGTDRNLLDIPFSTAQVAGAEEHKLLMRLRDSELSDDAAVEELFAKIGASYQSGDNYCILLTFNRYDVPYRGKDGGRYDDAGEETYRSVLCAICPVKATKSGLTYAPDEKNFRNYSGDNAICAPEAGFLFPAFDDRKTNIYNTLFYTRSTEESHEALTMALFGGKIAMPAAEQQAGFRSLLADTLAEDCNLQVVRAVRAQIAARMEEHKESKTPDPLFLSQSQMREILEESGISDDKIATFDKAYQENFGAGIDLVPKNIINPKKFELKTPSVSIKVSPEGQDLVETRVIDGVKYVLIRADDGVELNGLDVKIK